MHLLRRGDDAAFAFQSHPNINKAALGAPGGEGAIAHKQADRAFPTGAPVGVLRWRFAAKDADAQQLPLMITCWPEEAAGGLITVNVEYTLQREDVTLGELVVTVPLGPGSEAPRVASCDGVFKHSARDGTLAWRVESVSAGEARSGAMEFSVKASRGVTLDSFFPVRVTFSSADTLVGLKVTDVVGADDGKSLRHSVTSGMSVEEYIVE